MQPWELNIKLNNLLEIAREIQGKPDASWLRQWEQVKVIYPVDEAIKAKMDNCRDIAERS